MTSELAANETDECKLCRHTREKHEGGKGACTDDIIVTERNQHGEGEAFEPCGCFFFHEYPPIGKFPGPVALALRLSYALARPLPSFVRDAGPEAEAFTAEFFAARIPNVHTRAAYERAVRRFATWAEARGLELAHVNPVHAAAYVQGLGEKAPGTERQLAPRGPEAVVRLAHATRGVPRQSHRVGEGAAPQRP